MFRHICHSAPMAGPNTQIHILALPELQPGDPNTLAVVVGCGGRAVVVVVVVVVVFAVVVVVGVVLLVLVVLVVFVVMVLVAVLASLSVCLSVSLSLCMLRRSGLRGDNKESKRPSGRQ